MEVRLGRISVRRGSVQIFLMHVYSSKYQFDLFRIDLNRRQPREGHRRMLLG